MLELIDFKSAEKAFLSKGFNLINNIDPWIFTLIENWIYQSMVTFFPNTRKIKGRFRTRYGNKDGNYILYHDDESIAEKGNYINGKLDGIIYRFHKNGTLHEQLRYENGSHEGVTRSWYDNGQMSGFYIAKRGWHEGEIKAWYRDGTLSFHGFEINRKRQGERKHFYENGNIESLLTYDDGKLISARYYDRNGNCIHSIN